MVREEVVICIDNSEYMRNGDYSPTRMDAQQEAANVICGAKTSQNVETTMAIVSMGAKCPRVEVALTNDLGKLLATLSSIPISGNVNFTTSIRVSQLALKKRSNEQANPQKRIIAFVGSPLQENDEQLVVLALELLKANIAVDVINFGEEVANTEKLDAFVSTLNQSEQNSRLVTIPPGPHILSDMVLKSPIVLGNEAAQSSGATGSASDAGAMAIDPNEDPQLALAIRLSLEEDQRRREREQGTSTAQQQATPAAPQQGTTSVAHSSSADDDIYMDEEDEALQAALRLSMQQEATPITPANQQKLPTATPQAPVKRDDKAEAEEDEDLELALKLSQQPQQKDEDIKDILQDEEFLDKVIGNLGNKKDDKKDDSKKDEQK